MYDEPQRAPIPPNPAVASDFKDWEESIPYPLSSESEIGERVSQPQRRKESYRDGYLGQETRSYRSISMPRPAYVREATDGGTEKVAVNLPYRQQRSIEYDIEDYESMASGLTEKERDAETRSRHVTFRDDLSQRSEEEEGWTDTDSRRGDSDVEGGDIASRVAW